MATVFKFNTTAVTVVLSDDLVLSSCGHLFAQCLHRLQPHTSWRSRDSRWPAPTGAHRDGLPGQRWHMSLSQGQLLARAHLSTSRWPPQAAYTQVNWSAVGARPLEESKPAVCCKLLAPVLLLVGTSVGWVWGAGGGAHPGGAHEATGNEAHAVDVAEHHFHQLGHQFPHHHPLLVVVVVVELLDVPSRVPVCQNQIAIWPMPATEEAWCKQ
jgi:hypothetical protein